MSTVNGGVTVNGESTVNGAAATGGEIVTVSGSARRDTRGRQAGDPVVTEVVRHGLAAAADQMRIALRRTAFSPIIYEVSDFACALYDRDFRLLSQAKSFPIFLGTLSFCVESAVEAVGGPAALEDGDVLFSTYAYDIGSHQQDAAVVVPAFRDGRLNGYAAIKAHHVDIGAKAPYCTDTIDVFQEGVIFPGVKIYAAGELQRDLYRTLLANSRAPRALAGDLRAQVGAARIGIQQMQRLIGRFGEQVFRQAVEDMFDHGEESMAAFLRDLPDGRYTAEGRMDDNGVTDEEVPIRVAVEIEGDRATIDFSESADQQVGPVNSPLASTVSAARMALLAVGAGEEMANEGHFRPITIRARRGGMFCPEPPAPVYLYFWAALQAVDVVHLALADALPDRIRAGSGGDITCLIWWGHDQEGRFWSGASNHLTGQGATPGQDGGAPLMHIGCSGMRNSPIEVFETRNPIQVESWEYIPDSAGAGQFAGGNGVRIVYRALEDLQVTSTIERTRLKPWGLQGGEPGRANRQRVIEADGSASELGKVTGFDLRAGMALEVEIGAGGGLGPPAERSADLIERDLEAGLITEGAAQAAYGFDKRVEENR